MDQWGWNPTSFEAIGTVAAAIWAAIAIYVSRKQGLEDARREMAALDAETKRNARMVWMTLLYEGEFGDTPEGPGGVRYLFQVVNRSPETIYYPQVVLEIDQTRGRRATQLLDPESSAQVSSRTLLQAWLGGGSASWWIGRSWLPNELGSGQSLSRTIDLSDGLADDLRAVLHFTDATRVRWSVGDDGSVRRSAQDHRIKWKQSHE